MELNKFKSYYNELNARAIQRANQLGIDATKKVILNSIGLVKRIYDATKDGFQFSDILIVPAVVSDVISITSSLEKAKQELNDLTNDEKRILGELAIASFITNFNVNLGGGNATGIDNIKTALDSLFKLIKDVRGALKDGFQVTDVIYLPNIISNIVWVLLNTSKLKTEFNDISKEELVTLSGLIVLYIYGIIFEG